MDLTETMKLTVLRNVIQTFVELEKSHLMPYKTNRSPLSFKKLYNIDYFSYMIKYIGCL